MYIYILESRAALRAALILVGGLPLPKPPVYKVTASCKHRLAGSRHHIENNLCTKMLQRQIMGERVTP